jgi:hypothetical protein
MKTCGHSSKTFTYHALGRIWLCGACHASIGRLGDSCARCAAFAASGAVLVDVRHVGRLCLPCRREHLRDARPTF